ncbi:MAG: truncated hemoglobin [Vulcanimicrobiota bacterium]
MRLTTDIHQRGTLASSLYPRPQLLAELGGREFVQRWIDGLYDRLEVDPELRPLFRKDLDAERAAQKAFFEQWLGGRSLYGDRPSLAAVHDHVVITPRAAGVWLKHAGESLKAAGASPQQAMETLMALGPLARGLINSPARAQPGQRVAELKAGLTAVRSGRPPRGNFRQEWLVLAAWLGRQSLVEQFLAEGADPNRAARLPGGKVCLTPLAAALAAGQAPGPLGELALDFFSVAYLGDTTALATLLEQAPELLEANDPAEDFRPARALHHALAGGQSLDFLLERGASLEPGSAGLLVQALGHRRSALALLERGASLTEIEPGPWLLDGEVSQALYRAGLRARPSWSARLRRRPSWRQPAQRFF